MGPFVFHKLSLKSENLEVSRLKTIYFIFKKRVENLLPSFEIFRGAPSSSYFLDVNLDFRPYKKQTTPISAKRKKTQKKCITTIQTLIMINKLLVSVKELKLQFYISYEFHVMNLWVINQVDHVKARFTKLLIVLIID